MSCAGTPATDPPRPLLRLQYQIPDPSFCQAATCVDYEQDGRRAILFASRSTGKLQLVEAANGAVRWERELDGRQQSLSVYDVDGDGAWEILYSVSDPGRLYLLDQNGNLLRQWDSADSKLGNSPVILDGDGDGVLDGYLGTRTNALVRLNMANLAVLNQRDNWVQCGCYTSAMDVDLDGRWDLFAGSGDDTSAKGSLVRFDPISLKSIWSWSTNDNASSADAVLADIDDDGFVEVIKSVDNYAGDDPHDAIYAFETDGELLWKVPGLAGEDSPNIADLDGDGDVEIVGMTFGSMVYCLDAKGKLQWSQDLRPELDDSAHAYLAPILGDVDGDRELEVIALTNGGFTQQAHGIVFALSADGEIIDKLDVGGDRYWGEAFYCNVDDDPFLEIVVSGSGGMDVIETRGVGPATEHFQRRRSYQRLNVIPWAYEDSYFIYRGTRDGVRNLTDNLVLDSSAAGDRRSGRFITETLSLPPRHCFTSFACEKRTPRGTTIAVNVLDDAGASLERDVRSGSNLNLAESVRLEFVLSTEDPDVTPVLDSYRLDFELQEPAPPPGFRKSNQIVLDVGGQNSFDSCQAKYPSISRVGEEWWMWYSGRASDCFTGSIGLATSDDGLEWVKHDDGGPVFEHGIPGTFDSTKTDHPAVLRFGGRFHMWYTAGDDENRYTVGYATSNDGIHWRRENGGRPVFLPGAEGEFDDREVLHPAVVRDESGTLHMWYNGVGPQKTFRVGHAVSRDGVRWQRENGGKAVLAPSVVGGFDEGYVYNVHVRLEGEIFHMWYSAWVAGERSTGANHNGLTYAWSHDGNHWKKDTSPTLTNGAPGQSDEYACFGCFVVSREEGMWMYYSMADDEKIYRVGLARQTLVPPSLAPSGKLLSAESS
ncbi:MAG: hypothetical protein ABGZ35_24885, partial [Planctomycetaceae bacterium]